MKSTLLSLLMVTAMTVALVGCGGNNTKEVHEINKTVEKKAESAATNDTATADSDEDMNQTDGDLLQGKYAVLISVEDYGDIFVELDADEAPLTVTNFMKLVNEDYYSGLTFHRIIEGFMMQGGQSDKPAATIKGEFAANGMKNTIKHERGTISMARTGDPNSASSQFFICQEDCEFLDGQYAAFGHVVFGMDVVDRICNEAVVIDDNGTVPKENQPIIAGIYDTTSEYLGAMTEEGNFIPSNSFEEEVGRDTFDSYDEIISMLPSGMGYAYAEILGAEEPVLIVATEGMYDYENGNMAAIEATPYLKKSDGRVTSGSLLSSGGTAYPIAILDGVIYCGSNHSMSGLSISSDYEDPGIMSMFYLYEEFDTDANVTYGGFIRDTNSLMTDGEDVAEDDDKPLADSYKAYEKAEPIYFTVIE